MPVPKISKHKKKHDKQDVQLVAQEIKFARVLAGNDKRSRDKILKTLKKWFKVRFDKGTELKEEDFARIWKGLFYAVWMSDKPLVQEELCEEIAGVVDLFPTSQVAECALFVKAAFRVLAAEWFGIDHHRIDKFLMLVRRVLRGVFRWVRRGGWSVRAAGAVSAALGGEQGLLSCARPPPAHTRNALALQLHLADCYLEELAKVSEESISGECVARLVSPLVRYMALGGEPRLCAAIKKNVFTFLFRQSDMGQEYEAKKRAWVKVGCPMGGPEAMQKVEDSDEDESNADEDAKEAQEDSGSDDESRGAGGGGGGGDAAALDPRAGRVDVVLRPLPVPCAELARQLRALATRPATTLANRHRVRQCIALLEEYERGVYPLRLRKWEGEGAGEGTSLRLPRARTAALKLRRVERALSHSADELCVRGLSRKHRKRVMSRRAELSAPAPGGAVGAESADTDSAPPVKRKKSSPRNNNSGQWQVEDTEPIKKLQLAAAGNNSGKENQPQKKKLKRKKKNNKSPTTLQDEVPLKKLKTLIKEKESATSPNVGGNALKEKNKHAKATKKEKHVVNGQQDVTNGSADKGLEKNETVKNHDKNNKSKKILRSLQKAIVQSDRTTKNKPIGEDDGGQKRLLRANDSNKNKLETTKSSPAVQTTPAKVASGAKKVKFLLKNTSAQAPLDYYKSVRKSPSIPFEPSKKPQKTNLKPSTPSPINPFFKKKLKLNL